MHKPSQSSPTALSPVSLSLSFFCAFITAVLRERNEWRCLVRPRDRRRYGVVGVVSHIKDIVREMESSLKNALGVGEGEEERRAERKRRRRRRRRLLRSPISKTTTKRKRAIYLVKRRARTTKKRRNVSSRRVLQSGAGTSGKNRKKRTEAMRRQRLSTRLILDSRRARYE